MAPGISPRKDLRPTSLICPPPNRYGSLLRKYTPHSSGIHVFVCQPIQALIDQTFATARSPIGVQTADSTRPACPDSRHSGGCKSEHSSGIEEHVTEWNL